MYIHKELIVRNLVVFGEYGSVKDEASVYAFNSYLASEVSDRFSPFLENEKPSRMTKMPTRAP